MINLDRNRLLNTLRSLIVIWLFETIIASILYSFDVFFGNETIFYILYLNVFRFLYYYIFLFFIYAIKINYTMKFITIVNLSVFLIVSILLSIIYKGAYELFFELSFICNFLAIVVTPTVLYFSQKKLPAIFRIY